MSVVVAVTCVVLCAAVLAAGYIHAPDWKNCDSSWGLDKVGNCSFSICNSDGSLVSLAMYMAAGGGGPGNPGKVNKLMKEINCFNPDCSLNWQCVATVVGHYNGTRRPEYDEMPHLIDSNACVIGRFREDSTYALVVGYDITNFLIANNPRGNSGPTLYKDFKDFVVILPY